MKAPPRRPEAAPPEPQARRRPDPRAAALRDSLRRMAERPETAEALARALRFWLRSDG